MEEKIDYGRCTLALENLKNIQEMIRHIDQKVYLTLIVYGFLINFFLKEFQNSNFFNPFNFSGLKFWICFGTFFFGALFLISIIYQIWFVLFKIICSRSSKNYKADEIDCLFYFSHINKMSKTKFLENFKNSEIKLLNDILTQIYEVSRILDSKSKNYNKLLKFIFISIILLTIFSIFLNLA